MKDQQKIESIDSDAVVTKRNATSNEKVDEDIYK
jgi:hypothetical protein